VTSIGGTGGIVLAGGRSTRMGTAKAALEWHGSTLLRRMTGLVGRVVDGPVVVVAAPGQRLPSLPERVELAADPAEGRGPLQGIAVGLAALAGRAETAFVCAVDLPFLHPAFVRRVLRGLADGADVALPVVRGYPQPLAAGYRTALAPLAAGLLAAGRARVGGLAERCAAQRLGEATLLADPVLAALDPDLDSVRNLNSPSDYATARARPAPWILVWYGGRQAPVEAATLATAAELVLPARGQVAVRVELNGDRVGWDDELPLATGDRLALSLRPR